MPATLLRRDWPLRLGGIGALIVGVTCMALLFDGHVAPTGAIGAAAAAVGFLGCSGGAMLVILGAHLHDPIAVARPWGGKLSSHWTTPADLSAEHPPTRRSPGATSQRD